MLLDQPTEAWNDFDKAVSLNANFPAALVQKLYEDYRLAVSLSDANKVAAAMFAFEDSVRRFPECPECYLLYAQVCLISLINKFLEKKKLCSILGVDGSKRFCKGGRLFKESLRRGSAKRHCLRPSRLNQFINGSDLRRT